MILSCFEARIALFFLLVAGKGGRRLSSSVWDVCQRPNDPHARPEYIHRLFFWGGRVSYGNVTKVLPNQIPGARFVAVGCFCSFRYLRVWRP